MTLPWAFSVGWILLKYTRLHTGDDNQSHFEDCEIPVAENPVGRLSEKTTATGILFRENDPSYDLDWHPAPARQFVIMLEGLVEIEVGSGEKRIFKPGDILLAEDTTGQGHRSRIPDGKSRRSIFVTLD